MIVWHATDMKNLLSISDEGINASLEGGVYVAMTWEEAARFVVFRGYEEILVVPIETDYVQEVFDHNEEFFGCKAYMTKGSVEPYKIDLSNARVIKNPIISDKENTGK